MRTLATEHAADDETLLMRYDRAAMAVQAREFGEVGEAGEVAEDSPAVMTSCRHPVKTMSISFLVVMVSVVIIGKVIAPQVMAWSTNSASSTVQLDSEAAKHASDHAHKEHKTDLQGVKKEVKLGSSNHSAAHANVSTTTSFPCHTAQPGEPCYDAVMWHKWIGVIENPGAYPYGTWRGSNRKQIQEFLASSGQGQCQRPCDDDEAYPVPAKPAKKSPSIYCFSVARVGPEMDTMYMQRQGGMGIFACDGTAVFSDADVDIDGIKTIKIGSTASGVSVDRTAANSQVFMRTWMTLLDSDEWWHYDFIAKVDPDAVLFPERLRGHLAWHTGQDVFFLNCAKYSAMMYGALEVISKAALGAYHDGHGRCEGSLPYWSWGEDKYMGNCLEMLGVATQPDYLNFLHDERCWGVDCGNKAAVAFHAFKSVNSWYHCYLASK